MDVGLFCLDPYKVDLRNLCSGNGDCCWRKEDWFEAAEPADLHLLGYRGHAGRVNRQTAPATPHPCEAVRGPARLSTFGTF